VISLKKKKVLVFVIITIVIIGIGIVFIFNLPSSSISTNEYTVQKAFPNLTFNKPVGIYDAGDNSNHLFVVEQDGRIRIFNNTPHANNSIIFLDMSVEVISGGERGLLGLTFHPNYEVNGYLFIYYTESVTGDSIISRFKVDSGNSNQANKSSEVEILRIPQPNINHNGGQIQFGPDGYLYIALGDGGGSGDPGGHGQNPQTLLGSILRIDVDSSLPYAIPIDNPFYMNINGWKEEIYAFGFRNPWRFSFDPNTQLLWVGDVGQSSREEIDIVKNGSNYGWSTKEGTLNFDPNTNITALEDPFFEYSHTIGGAITGGFVYRGSALPGLIGNYIYADYGSGRIWALDFAGEVVLNNTLLIDTTLLIPSLGVDANNELLICAFDGMIYKLIKV
jgi:glucose/arabinose dehydrogenase